MLILVEWESREAFETYRTDPDLADTRTYRSSAFYFVVEDPARLDELAFRVGDEVDPFVVKNGDDLELSWPAVAGSESYRVRVWDLEAARERRRGERPPGCAGTGGRTPDGRRNRRSKTHPVAPPPARSDCSKRPVRPESILC